jgi:hypothetical protein
MPIQLSTCAQRIALCAAALIAPSIDVGPSITWHHSQARAQTNDATEKEAFEAAKELGTVEAWDAFLSNYSTGFRADLARAYVKKLAADTPASTPAAATATAPPPSQQTDDYPTEAGSWGGIVRSGPGRDYRQVESLKEGERITLMGRSDVMENGYPWFKIAFRDGQTGYKWGGILCATGPERPDIFQTCPAEPQRAEPQRKVESKREAKQEPKGCGRSSIRIDGRCVKKRDAATHCGPGYRLKGNTCVQGYQAPKQQAQRPSWQIEAIKKGCKPGMGWNPQEGCHEND